MSGYNLNGTRWGAGPYGTPGGQVTWSFVANNFPGQTYVFDFQINAEFRGAVRAAFDRWEGAASLDFVEVGDAADVDIRLGFDAIDGAGRTAGEASYRFTGFSPARLTSAEVRFDSAEGWDLIGNDAVADNGVSLYALALHEIGHSIGLGHAEGSPLIMNAVLRVQDLQPGDIAGVRAIYGTAGAVAGIVLSGGPGNDSLHARAGNDTIAADEGNDRLAGDGGNDTLEGGPGTDVAVYRGPRNEYVVTQPPPPP